MRSPLAYVPRRTPLAQAGAFGASVYLGSLALVAFVYSNPIVLGAAGLGVIVAGLAAKAGRALRASVRWGLALGVLIIVVNGLVAQRGDTVLVYGLWLPLLGHTDVSAEALAEGAILALRILVVMMAFAVHSASVDPDRVLRMLRPLARRSALTATLIARLVPLAAADYVRLGEAAALRGPAAAPVGRAAMARRSALTATLIARLVPLAAADYVRLGEAAALRGPAAAPVGRAAMARRLVAGSLDRAVDVAATLELRGYAHGAPRSARGGPPNRYGTRFICAGLAIAAVSIGARIAGVGAFDSYPTVSIATDAPTLLLAAGVAVAAALPFATARGRRRSG
jgi:energy-coupling factor transport system permease protein